MSDTESHEFIPPQEDELDEEDDDLADGDIDGPECASCGEQSTGVNLVPCPTCGGDWCFDCFEEHIKDEPTHMPTFKPTRGGELDADDSAAERDESQTDNHGLRSGDERQD